MADHRHIFVSFRGLWPVASACLLAATLGLGACASSPLAGYVAVTAGPTRHHSFEEAQRILKGFNIESRSQDGVLFVPKEHEKRAAMILSFNNLIPNGHEQYGFLSDRDLAHLETAPLEAYRLDLQEMLGRAIVGMDGIEEAKVVFLEFHQRWKMRLPDDNRHPKASVLVRTRDGVRLAEDKVIQIAILVAGSLTDLRVENVQISDVNGVAYALPTRWQAAYSKIKLKANTERDLATKVEQALFLSGYAATTTITGCVETSDASHSVSSRKKPSASSNTDGGPVSRVSVVDRPYFVPDLRPTLLFDSYDWARVPTESIVVAEESFSDVSEDPRVVIEKSTVAVTIRRAQPLTPTEIAEVKSLVTKATSIPESNVSVLFVESQSSQPSGR